MQGRNLVLSAMRHQAVDRTPVFEYVLLSPNADRALGRPLIGYDENPDEWLRYARETGYDRALRQYARDRVELALRLRHDMLYVCPAPIEFVPSAAVPGGEPEERLAKRNELDTKSLTRPFPDAGYQVYGFIREAMREKDADLALFAPAYTLGIWSDVDLMMTMLIDPEIAREHFRLAADVAILQVTRYARDGIELIGIGGDFAGNRLLISPEAYREFVVPEVRRVADKVHDSGAYAVTASDGDLRSVLDDFLIGSGADAYMEIDSRAGMDLKMLKDRYGDRICLMGIIDCGELLSYGSPEAIREATQKCLKDGWGMGGHIFTASNAIAASVPFENYRAMSDAYHDHFGLKRVEWIG
jgi:uroporphyrinogen decarboxylase